MCSKRRRVRLLCLLGTSCEVSPSAATGGPQSARAHSGAGKTRNVQHQKLLHMSQFACAKRLRSLYANIEVVVELLYSPMRLARFEGLFLFHFAWFVPVPTAHSMLRSGTSANMEDDVGSTHPSKTSLISRSSFMGSIFPSHIEQRSLEVALRKVFSACCSLARGHPQRPGGSTKFQGEISWK